MIYHLILVNSIFIRSELSKNIDIDVIIVPWQFLNIEVCSSTAVWREIGVELATMLSKSIVGGHEGDDWGEQVEKQETLPENVILIENYIL